MTKPDWFAFYFLLGEWISQGGGTPGQGGGNLVFQFDLQQQILLRKNHVEFPAVQGQPAFAHDDLTVIFPDSSGRMRAIYFDNEGHSIYYSVGLTEDGKMITFVSEPSPSKPRFRTTYLKGQDETMVIRFEIAPPDKPDEFSIYTEGTAIRDISTESKG
jgi:hypothetical protein